MKIAIRMDDITADMNWKNFLALKELFDRHGICPLIGVVPDNRDEKSAYGSSQGRLLGVPR